MKEHNWYRVETAVNPKSVDPVRLIFYTNDGMQIFPMSLSSVRVIVGGLLKARLELFKMKHFR